MVWLAVAALSASAEPGEDEAKSCLNTKLYEAYGDGWRARVREVQALDVGKPEVLEVFLYGGREVRFIACAGAAAVNLDLLLVDAEGTVLARDTTRSREPELVVTVPQTGRYRLLSYLQAATGAAKVHSAVALTWR